MTTYKSYAACKIAHPDSEIVTTGKSWDYEKETIGTFEVRLFDEDDGAHIISDYAWVVCNPADHCSSLKEFLEAGFKLVEGDAFINVNGSAETVTQWTDNFLNAKGGEKDMTRFIISAAALNGGCKIPAKAEQWTVYNNTMPLCELTDEQYGKMRRAHDIGATVQSLNEDGYGFQDCALPTWISNGVYRIKPKSERELFIDLATEIASEECETERIKESIDAFIVKLFDSGKFKYIDNTSYFGESI